MEPIIYIPPPEQKKNRITLDNENYFLNEGVIQSLLQFYLLAVVALRATCKALKATINMKIPCSEKLSLLQPKSLPRIRLPKFSLPPFGYNLLREVLRHNFHSTCPPIRLKVWDENINIFLKHDSILSILKYYKPIIHIIARSENKLKECILQPTVICL